MVESVLKAADLGLKVRLVHASQGKSARAEPIALKFEKGKAFFAGEFPELEAELGGMIAGGGYEGPGRSPDRADAMVWAMTVLSETRSGLPRVRRLVELTSVADKAFSAGVKIMFAPSAKSEGVLHGDIAGTYSTRTRGRTCLSGTPRAHAIDRWIYVLMAAWFIAIVLVGFIPDAMMKVGAGECRGAAAVPAGAAFARGADGVVPAAAAGADRG